jgi:hypothetical protein
MILMNYASLGRMPAFIIVASLGAAVCMYLAGVAYTIRPPLAVVDGANRYLPAVRPLDVPNEYVERFATLFIEKYASWNIYSYQLNRNVALRMLSIPLANTVLAETQQTDYLVRVFQASATVVPISLDVTRLGDDRWVVKAAYQQQMFDAGVPRVPDRKQMTMVLRRISPDFSNPFCLEIETLDDRRLSPEEVAAIESPQPTPQTTTDTP